MWSVFGNNAAIAPLIDIDGADCAGKTVSESCTKVHQAVLTWNCNSATYVDKRSRARSMKKRNSVELIENRENSIVKFYRQNLSIW